MKLIAALVVVLAAPCHALEVAYFATSKHFESKSSAGQRYNAKHNFFSIEHNGFAVASFTNSYYQQGFIVDCAKYWQLAPGWEGSLRAGVATGYGYKPLLGVTPVGAAAIAYTANPRFIPKISIIPGAVVLSFSTRF